MSLFGNLFGKRRKKDVSNADDAAEKERFRCFDKVEYQFESAADFYCGKNNISDGDLSDEDIDEINRRAGNHIGVFITWLFDNHFENEDADSEAAERVRSGELSGVDYLLEYCDGKFWGVDFRDEIYPFVNVYYERSYFKDYCDWAKDNVLETVSSFEDYRSFKPVIDRAYEKFCENT